MWVRDLIAILYSVNQEYKTGTEIVMASVNSDHRDSLIKDFSPKQRHIGPLPLEEKVAYAHQYEN